MICFRTNPKRGMFAGDGCFVSGFNLPTNPKRGMFAGDGCFVSGFNPLPTLRGACLLEMGALRMSGFNLPTNAGRGMMGALFQGGWWVPSPYQC